MHLGMSTRPLVSDMFTGITPLFDDQFPIGESGIEERYE